jgi:hypothetical protein
VWLATEPFHECLSYTRLADTGFTRDQHHATFAALRLLPASQEQIKLLLASDQRSGRRTQSFEAALHRTWAHHLVGLHPIGKALCLDATEITVLKETAEQTAGGCVNGDRARRRRRLQPRRQIRRLAYHAAFLGVA